MAIAVWPVTLPQTPLLDGLSNTRETSVRTFKPDVGRPIRSSASTKSYEVFSITMRFDEAQYTIFWAFWETDLQHGLLPFTFKHPFTGVSKTVEFAGEEPPTTDLVPQSNMKWDMRANIRILS